MRTIYIKNTFMEVNIMFRKKIVVMDGSDKDRLMAMSAIIKMMTSEKNKVTCEPLDEDHPTIIVVEFKSNRTIYDQIANIFEELWPGLCTANVAV